MSEATQDDMRTLFRLGMRQQASTVCIITTVHDGQSHGMTATAMSSVSAEPPTLLVCINRSASLHAPVKASGRFAVNMLSCDHVDVAQRFSSKDNREGRFTGSQWAHRDGWAYLQDSCVSFLLTTEHVVDHHSHAILIGRVEQVMLGQRSMAPLIYHDGVYAQPVHLEASDG